MAFDCSAHGGAEAAQYVPPISYLDGVGGAGSSCFGVGAGAIACDDLDAWVLLEPSR